MPEEGRFGESDRKGAPDPSAGGERPGTRTRSLAQRLGALERSTGRSTGPVDDGALVRETAGPAAGSPEEAKGAGFIDNGLAALGFLREDAGFGEVWHRELRTDVLSRYGAVRFADLTGVDLAPVARACKTEAVQTAELLRFYDTETTGLGTGAGTFPFLHAVGQLAGDEWVVHQYFVGAYQDEPAVLQTLAGRHFGEGTVVASFNGRTFDWPLLQSRMIMYRLRSAIPTAHLDLLHPSRRLWKRMLGSTSLGRLEEVILGLTRTDDLPGKEAPARYFRYMDDGLAGPLGPVFDHNAADVSATAALLVVLAQVLSGQREAQSAGEFAALAKWYDEWQETELAERCLVLATDCPDTTWREYWLQSLFFKRRRRWDDASATWQEMASRYPTSIPPLVELAKHAEHHLGDLSRAHRYTTQAIASRLAVARAMRADTAAHGDDRVLAQLQHRLQRIARKQAAEAEATDR